MALNRAFIYKLIFCWIICIIYAKQKSASNATQQTNSARSVFEDAKEKSIIFIYSIIREGLSSPINLPESTIDIFGNSWPEGQYQLTAIGQRQSFLLGLHYREKLTNFLSEIYKPEEISLYSTNKNRCKQSLQSFLQGLYPQNLSKRAYQLKEEQIKKAVPPVHLSEPIQRKIVELNKSILDHNATVIPVRILKPDSLYDVLSSGKKCKGIDEYWNTYYFEAYTILKNFRSKWRQFFIDFMSEDLELGEHCYNLVLSFCDDLTTNMIAGKNLTILETFNVDVNELNASCIELMGKDKFLFRFGKINNYFLARMTASLLLKEIVNKFNAKIPQRGKYLSKKAVIFNCHTNLITAIISTLKFTFSNFEDIDIQEYIGPSYSLDFILYRQLNETQNEYFVEVKLNDIKFLNVKESDFVRLIENVIISELKIEDFCKMPISRTTVSLNDLFISACILVLFNLIFLVLAIMLKCKIKQKNKLERERINYFNN